MKIRNIITFSMLLGLIGFTSCIEDKSETVGSRANAAIAVQSTLNTGFEVDLNDVLRMTAPEVTQSPLQKDLNYSWEIDGTEVSTQNTLEYPCKLLGEHKGRLKITNGDNIVYQEFTFKVRFAYESGVYTLSEYNGKTIFSYINEREKGKKIIFDAFSKENPRLELGTKPTGLYYMDYYYGEEPYARHFYLATDSPAKLYRLQADTMNVVYSFDVSRTPVLGLYSSGHPVHRDDPGVTVKIAEGMKSVDDSDPALKSEAFYTKVNNFAIEGDITFEPSSKTSRHSAIVFSKDQSAIIVGNSLASVVLFDNLQDYDYVGSTQAGDYTRMNIVSVLRKKNTSDYQLYYYYPGYQTISTKRKKSPDTIDVRPIPEMRPQTAIGSIREKNLLLYSKGNQLYAYSLDSKGNFPDRPILSCDREGEIVKIVVNENKKLLIIGLNATSGEKVGCIYVYDINDTSKPRLLWKAEDSVGKITHLIYRP